MAGLKKLPEARALRAIEEHDPGQFSLFLGAGCSRSSGVALASEMIREWRRLAYTDEHPDEPPDDETIDAWAKKQDWARDPDFEYSELFEALYENELLRQKYIERKLDGAFPGWGYLYLGSIMQAGYFNITYTTNFDDLINDGLSTYLGYNPVVCAADSQMSTINPTSARVKIIKLHGDYLFQRLKNTRKELAKLDPNMEDKFRHFSRDRGLVVLGYAGRDRSVMGVLGSLLDEDSNCFPTNIYWGLRDADEPSEPLKIMVDKHPERVRLFRCNRFDHFMARLHTKLKLSLPASIDYPYQALRQKFDGLLKTEEGGKDDSTIAKHREKLKVKLVGELAKAEGSPKLALLEAQLKLTQRDYRGALEQLEEYSKGRKQDANSLTVWGGALAVESEETGDSGAMDRAAEKWLEAVELDPGAIAPRRSLTNYYMLRGRNHEAMAQCEALVRLAPNDTSARLNLSQFYMKSHRPDDALEQVDVLLRKEPDDAQLLAVRADVLAATGRLREALEHGRRAVELDPRNVWFRLGFGTYLFQAGDLAGGEREIREAIRLDPQNPTALHRLCILLATMGRTQELQAAMVDLARLSPALAQSFQAQMQAQMQQGQQFPARQASGQPGANPIGNFLRDLFDK